MPISYTDIARPSDPTYTDVLPFQNYLRINSTDYLLINATDKLVISDSNNGGFDDIYTEISIPA